MYAIVEIAGQQFKVQKDQKIFVHRLNEEAGQKVSFDKVLLIDNGGKITLGAPAINGASVSAKVEEHVKGDKVVVFRKKRRKGYAKRNGHRQYFTALTIQDIKASGSKPAAPKAEAKKEEKPAAPKADESGADLNSMTVAELKEMAKAKGIEGISSMKKADLIAALS